jgi:hypothetical protein
MRELAANEQRELEIDGYVLLRGVLEEGEDVREDVERVFGKPVAEVSGPLDYVAFSHTWPASVRAGITPTELGELHEAFQISSWTLGPGDAVVSHGNALRLRQPVGEGVDDGLSPVAGPDLGEDVVHVALHGGR